MFLKTKYYGEIWLPDNELKHFCVLNFKENEVTLETNLKSNRNSYKQDILVGLFNGLGYLTFINNIIHLNSNGVISVYIYNPEFTFVGSHHINPNTLKLKEFMIDNEALNNWIRHIHFYNFQDNFLEKEEDLRHKIKIESKYLDIEIIRNTSYSTNKDYFQLSNKGYISFKSAEDLNLLEGIELYKSFQKFLLFIYGESARFKSFKFKCQDCNEWLSLYYYDNLNKDDNFNFISLVYKNLEDNLNNILFNWYTSNDIQFCSDIVLENLLAAKVSNNRRFTNSLSAFEAYTQRFGKKYKKPTLKRYLVDEIELIIKLTGLSEDKINYSILKIIRSRDFYVHGNKGQKDVYSQFELLYISFLIDYIVGIRLLEQLKCSTIIVDKVIRMSNSTFKYSQPINRMLMNNPFNTNN